MDDSIPKPDDLDNNNFDFVEATGPGEAAAAFTAKQPRVEQAQGGGGREQQARQGRATEQSKLRPRTERGWAPQLDRDTMLQDPALANRTHNENLAYMAGVRLHEADRAVTDTVSKSGVSTQTVNERGNIRAARQIINTVDLSDDNVSLLGAIERDREKYLATGGRDGDPRETQMRYAADLARTVSREYHEAVDAKSSSDPDSSYTDRVKHADDAMKVKYDALSKRLTKTQTDERLADVRAELVRAQAEASQPSGSMTAAEVAAARKQYEGLNVSTRGSSKPAETDYAEDSRRVPDDERGRLAWYKDTIDPLTELDVRDFKAQFTGDIQAQYVDFVDKSIRAMIAGKINPNARYPGSVGGVLGSYSADIVRRIIAAQGGPAELLNDPVAVRQLKFKYSLSTYLHRIYASLLIKCCLVTVTL